MKQKQMHSIPNIGKCSDPCYTIHSLASCTLSILDLFELSVTILCKRILIIVTMEKAVPFKQSATYLGIFATDPKAAHKTVKALCKEAILETLKVVKPQSYQEEGQTTQKPDKLDYEAELGQKEMQAIQGDFINFQSFDAPKDNYHITCLFMGKNKDKLRKQEKQLMGEWSSGNKQPIKVDFMVYVPRHILTGFTSSTGKTKASNKFPHMTLLLKEKASAVQSNQVLATLHSKAPQIFEKRQKRVTIVNAAYGTISKVMIVIDRAFQLQGVTGDNFTCGKK